MPQSCVVSESDDCHSRYWLQTLLLDESAAGQRDAMQTANNNARLMTQICLDFDASVGALPRMSKDENAGGRAAGAAADQSAEQCSARH